MKKLRSIMLVDDDKHDNFFHERVIRKAGVAEEVVSVTMAEEALRYLEGSEDHPTPDLIFLDLNMPRIDGWAFIESYIDLPNSSLGHTKIVILSTSRDPDELVRAEENPAIHGFETKPLTVDMLNQLMDQYFS